MTLFISKMNSETPSMEVTCAFVNTCIVEFNFLSFYVIIYFLFTGTLVPGEAEKGHLYRLDPNYTLTQVADKVTLSNGLAWSLDNRTFYYVDSEKRIIHTFDYNLEDGTASMYFQNLSILASCTNQLPFPSRLANVLNSHCYIFQVTNKY